MENRFGWKDLLVCCLLAAVIACQFLAMKQFDRQWDHVQAIEKQQADQLDALATIQRLLAQGVRTTTSAQAPPTTAAVGSDPFARMKSAQALPGFATGDWFVDSIPKTDKLTPLVSGDAYAAEIQGRVLEGLVTRDPVTLDWQPLVAQSWKISDDGLTMTFSLRPGVVFSDGVDVTADDVVFTFAWIMNPKVQAPRERSSYEKLASVEKTGPAEVTFKFKEPYFQSFELAGTMPIMAKHFYSAYTPDQFNASTGLLLGSGPYRLVDPTGWAPGKQLELVRNERYWGEPAPFDKIVYKEIDNDLARLTAFRNGELDVFSAQPEQYRELLKDQDLLARTQHFEYDAPTGGYRYIAWNEIRNGQPTRFADKRVRQALTMLTDRTRICNEIMLGYATPSSGPFSPLGKQYNHQVQEWPFDPQAAKNLLAQAGYHSGADGILVGPDGAPFHFKLTYPSGSATYEQIVLFLKDTYASAGILMDPDPLDWSVFSQHLKNHDFDVISLGWSAGIEDDIYQMFDSSQIADEGDDFISYKNPQLDALIEQARKTVDETKRLPMWRECHRILNEDQPYTFLFTRKSLVFIDKRIQNVQKIPLGLNDLIEWYVPRPLRKWEK